MRGAWRRVGLEVDGAEVALEHVTVVWLQSKEWFVDVRLPGDDAGAPLSGPMAFAGTAQWDHPWMTWSHLVDLPARSGPAADRGRLQFLDGLLVEDGSWEADGRSIVYRERWSRVGDGECSARVERDSTMTRVRIAAGGWVADISGASTRSSSMATLSTVDPSGLETLVGRLDG